MHTLNFSIIQKVIEPYSISPLTHTLPSFPPPFINFSLFIHPSSASSYTNGYRRLSKKHFLQIPISLSLSFSPSFWIRNTIKPTSEYWNVIKAGTGAESVACPCWVDSIKRVRPIDFPFLVPLCSFGRGKSQFRKNNSAGQKYVVRVNEHGCQKRDRCERNEITERNFCNVDAGEFDGEGGSN